MLFDNESTISLKAYLSKELDPLSDADPEVLTDYVFALLKSDTSVEQLKRKCKDELVDFLQDATGPFVDKLFRTLKSKEYLNLTNPKRRHDATDHDVLPETKVLKSSSQPFSRDEHYGAAVPRPLRCKDYDEKGFCMRGDMCPYDHGVDHIIVDNPPQQGMMNMMDGRYPRGGPNAPSLGMMVPEYDPTTSLAFPIPRMGRGGGPIPISSGQPFNANGVNYEGPARGGPRFRGRGMDMNMRRGGRGRGVGRGAGRGSGGGIGSSLHGHSMGGQNTSLIVEYIPATHLNEGAVHSFFSKFGQISSVQINTFARYAIVSFSSNAEAYSAYNSPEPVFDNRFVRVHWAKTEKDVPGSQQRMPPPPSSSSPSGQALIESETQPRKEPIFITQPEQARIDAAKQKEEESRRRRQENLKAMLELQKQKEQLIQKQIEEQKRLMEKLSDKSIDAHEREFIKGQLKILNSSTLDMRQGNGNNMEGDGDVSMSESGGLNTTEELRKKVEALKAEASELGIDLSAEATQPRVFARARGRGSRGTFRGRSRGFPTWVRGRGTLTSGGLSSRVYKLDNRSTRIVFTEIPSGKDDELQTFLSTSFGPVEYSRDEEGHLVAEFSSRAIAERAIAGGRDISGVGIVNMQWVPMPASGAGSGLNKVPSGINESTGDDNMVDVNDTPAEQIYGQGSMADVGGDLENGTFDEDDDEEDKERSWKR